MKKTTKQMLFMVPILLIFIYGLTYMPKKIINMETARVSKITIFNGSTGIQMEITRKSDIAHIIENLKGVTFQKDKLAFGMGFSFRTTIYDNKGRSITKLIINSKDTIRYNGFSYKAKVSLIDYDFIQKLFDLYCDPYKEVCVVTNESSKKRTDTASRVS